MKQERNRLEAIKFCAVAMRVNLQLFDRAECKIPLRHVSYPQSLTRTKLSLSLSSLRLANGNELHVRSEVAQPRIIFMMSSDGINSVDDFMASIKKLLARGQTAKPDGGVEPALTLQDLEGDIETIGEQSPGSVNRNYAAIETACRNIFYDVLASTSIEEPAFGEIWNLFDVLSILSDLGTLSQARRCD